MVVSKDTSSDIYYLAKFYVLKEGSMGPPYWYLRDNIEKVQNSNGSVMWAMNSADYFKGDIANVENILNTYVKRLSQYGNVRRP